MGRIIPSILWKKWLKPFSDLNIIDGVTPSFFPTLVRHVHVIPTWRCSNYWSLVVKICPLNPDQMGEFSINFNNGQNFNRNTSDSFITRTNLPLTSMIQNVHEFSLVVDIARKFTSNGFKWDNSPKIHLNDSDFSCMFTRKIDHTPIMSFWSKSRPVGVPSII